MAKKFGLTLALVFIFSVYVTPVFAALVGPPATCDNFTSVRVGNTFVPVGSPDYINGFLAYHFSYNPAVASENVWLISNLMTADTCDYTGASSSNTGLVFPLGTNNFSIRFVSDNEFKFFNDSTNQPIVCDSCDIAFTPTVDAPYKIQFTLSNSHDSSKFIALPTDVRGIGKTPVLIVPGIMGTEVFKDTEELWPNVARMLLTPGDAFMDPLSYQDNGTQLDTSLVFSSVIDKKPKFDYTQALVDDFVSQGYGKNINLFLFPYDWRREIHEVAVTDDLQMKNPSLKQVIDQILTLRGSSKIDIIAHSQGGLVVKSLLSDSQYQGYQSKIDKLVFVGVPNLGAPMAAKALLYGDSMGVSFAGMGLDPAEVKKISANMPSVYELLPGQEYFNHANGYLGTARAVSPDLPIMHITSFGFASTTNYLINNSLNSGLLASSNAFHNQEFDNFNLSNSGIKAYNIVGCQTGTPGKIVVLNNGELRIMPVAGDGTVPIFSANKIPGAETFFALESDHATMLTQDGIRQEITNLITGTAAPASGKITPFVSDCSFNGTEVSSHSPVDLHIYDISGRHVGPTADGGFDSEIPNVGYDTIGHEHFAFLPAGGQYTVQLVATGAGSFNFDSTTIQNGETADATYYNHIPVTANSTASIDIGSGSDQKIYLDTDGDGASDATFSPSFTTGSDTVPPVSTSTIAGIMGKQGFYRSNATITLSSVDPNIDNTVSGVLNIQYSLDNGTTTIYQSPIAITSEGFHTISFFSTDQAGNNEQPQTITFTVDKTAPEAVIQFNPSLKDIQFSGTDNISTTSKVTVLDNLNNITLTDQAGNVTDIKLKEKDRKKSMQSTIQSLSYNGMAQDVSKNVLAFMWSYDKNNNLTKLTQSVAAKKTYVILAVYDGKKTTLAGIDKSGVILKSIIGLDLLKVFTNKGDLGWGY